VEVVAGVVHNVGVQVSLVDELLSLIRQELCPEIEGLLDSVVDLLLVLLEVTCYLIAIAILEGELVARLINFALLAFDFCNVIE
jgi:hypothetical protein